MATKIQSLEELLESEEITKRSKTPSQEQLLSQVGVRTKQQKAADAKAKKEEEKIVLAGNTINALRRNATDTLNRYIRSNPHYKTLKQQIEVIKSEMIAYKRAGKTEHFEFLKAQLADLRQNVKKFENIVKTEKKADREEKIERVKNSERLKELKTERDKLEAEYAAKNPNTILTRLTELRNRVETKNKYSDDVEDIEDVLDSDSDIDIISTNDSYEALLHDISELTEIDTDTLDSMSVTEIMHAIRENQTDIDKKELEELKMKIEANKMDASSEIKRLKGYHDITDVMFSMFDFETDEEQPKEMLAAANVKYVQAIAYNICAKQNMLRNYEDAVSYGLIGLTMAINKWYNIQKLKDSALSFEGFAHSYITNSIKRGLYDLSSGGMITGSARANLEHKRKKEIDYWLKHNSELKDIPEQYIEDIVDGMGYGKVSSPTTESDYNAIIGGEQSDADFWSRTIVDDSNEDLLVETKMEAENLAASLKSLFSMFKTNVDKETGIKKITDKKLFDQYDYQLFLMHFGLKTKYDKATGKIRNYNQTEMAEELSKLYAANGARKTFSQPAINVRIKQIMSKINNVMKLYPEIRKGFEYLLYHVTANSGNMAKISANREEYGISYDLKTELKSEKSQFAAAVNNGKKLSEMYGVTAQTTDEEIADLFTMGGANVKVVRK